MIYEDTNFPQQKIYDIEWKRIDGRILHEGGYVIQKSNHTNEAKLIIEKMSDWHVGAYACYVYASSGTVRRITEIKAVNKQGFLIASNKSSHSKQINLNIENFEHGFKNYKPILNKRYYFECVTGKMLPFTILKLAKKMNL